MLTFTAHLQHIYYMYTHSQSYKVPCDYFRGHTDSAAMEDLLQQPLPAVPITLMLMCLSLDQHLPCTTST